MKEEAKIHKETVSNNATFNEFVGRNFVLNLVPEYLETISKGLEAFPHRQVNPNYWSLLAMMTQLAADYGYPMPQGHLYRGIGLAKGRFDILHPIRLLETARYLAGINLQSLVFKKECLEYYRQLGDESLDRRQMIMGRYSIPRRGIVYLPAPHDFFRSLPYEHPQVRSDRLHYRLPITINPDERSYGNISRITISLEQLPELDKETFLSENRPTIQQAFPDFDVLSVFDHPGETW